MLSVFADDSSDETQKRTVAVAGIIASDEEWSRLDRTWLERTSGIPFHATDCESDRGAYAAYCHLDNQNLYKDLATILARSDSWGGAQRWIWLATENFSSLTKRLATTRRFLQL
jgi:hypothetical protein